MSAGATPAAGVGKRTRRFLVRSLVRLMLTVLAGLRWLARLRRPIDRERPEGVDILLTGTFHSDNWIRSHLVPLAASRRCRRVRIVTSFPVPEIERVVLISPPRWLRRVIGEVPARLVCVVAEGLRERPDWLGGFHLLINGLVVGVLAPAIGSRSLYFCVGGPAEILDGGLGGENRIFSRLEVPDPVSEAMLLRAADEFDLIITMGEGARRFFKTRTRARSVEVVGGGIDGRRFHPARAEPTADLVFVGRLAPIKRVDLFIRTVALVANTRPQVTAMIVGDGALRGELEALVGELGLRKNVVFLGQRRDVEDQLRLARVFMLTSESEGLSLAVVEAMMCGLPAIVPAVGDLGDLVKDGANGYLVEGADPEGFARPIREVLDNPDLLARLRARAIETGAGYEQGKTTRRWDTIFDATGGRSSLG